MNEDLVGPNDVTSVREIPLDNGNILYLRRTDPYGFFVFGLLRGQIPVWLRGQYTTLTASPPAVSPSLR